MSAECGPATESIRRAWIDVARGIAIVLVVFGHVERGLVSAGIWTDPARITADFVIYSFHVPFFFVLAGLNAPGSIERRGSTSFMTDKLWTVAYPYILWSTIQTLVQIAFAQQANGAANLRDLLEIGWDPISPFWFLYVLFICHLALGVIGPRPAVLACFAVAAYVLAQHLGDSSLLRLTLRGFAFYAIGALLCGYCDVPPPRPGLTALGLWTLFSAVGAPFGLKFSPDDFRAFIVAPATVLGIAATWATSWALKGAPAAVFALLGRASVTIYVMHIIFAAGIRAILIKLGVPPLPWLYASAGVLAGLGAPLIAHIALTRARLLPLFGLAPPKPRALPTGA